MGKENFCKPSTFHGPSPLYFLVALAFGPSLNSLVQGKLLICYVWLIKYFQILRLFNLVLHNIKTNGMEGIVNHMCQYVNLVQGVKLGIKDACTFVRRHCLLNTCSCLMTNKKIGNRTRSMDFVWIKLENEEEAIANEPSPNNRTKIRESKV